MASLCIVKLDHLHRVDGFDCGREPLNRFLIRFALQNQQTGSSRTYLALAGEQIAGFYTLAVGQVEYEDAPPRLIKGLAHHPVPIMLLARLAIAMEWQGMGLGAGLLKDAMLRTLQAAEIAGIRAFAVHAKNDQARAFYEHFDFVPSPADPYHLFRLLKDLRGFMKTQNAGSLLCSG